MKHKQTILFLASWYPTPKNPTHGIFIKNHALALSKYLNVIVVYAYSSNNKQENFKIIKTKQENFQEWLLEYKKVKHLPVISSLIKFYRFKKAYCILLNDLIANKITIDAIQLNTIFPVAIALPLFKKYFNVLHTIVEHWSGYLPEDGNYNNFLQKKITQKVIRTSKTIFYVSEKQKRAMQHHNLNGNYQLIYNTVNTSIFNENKKIKSQKPLLLHVSSLVEKEKNITGTLNVIQQLQKANYKFDVVVVGGNEKSVAFYKEKSKHLNLINISFVGEKNQLEVAAYMQKAHALILFSNYEGMPVVVLESLACGLPVFVSNVGQLPNLINNDFGKLVSAGNESELELVLKEFLDGKLTFNSEKMKEFILHCASQEAVGKKLADFYIAACSSTNAVNSTN